MNTLLTIGIICVVGLIACYAPQIARFVDSLINWHFGG